MKILYAEDETVLRDEIAMILELEGHEVVTAEDGQHAWDIFQADVPDLIITDIKMPHLSGIEFLSLVRAQQLNSIPAVVTSAYAEQDFAADIERLQVTTYMMKPFSLMGLIGFVNSLEQV